MLGYDCVLATSIDTKYMVCWELRRWAISAAATFWFNISRVSMSLSAGWRRYVALFAPQPPSCRSSVTSVLLRKSRTIFPDISSMDTLYKGFYLSKECEKNFNSTIQVVTSNSKRSQQPCAAQSDGSTFPHRSIDKSPHLAPLSYKTNDTAQVQRPDQVPTSTLE